MSINACGFRDKPRGGDMTRLSLLFFPLVFHSTRLLRVEDETERLDKAIHEQQHQ